MKFITFRETEIDIAAIFDANRGNSEWNTEAADPHIEGDVRLRANGADGSKIRDSISRTDPKLRGSVIGRLKEENGVIFIPAGSLSIGNLTACKLCDLPYNSAVKTVSWSPFSHIAQYSNFARKPSIASPLDVVRNEAVERSEHQHCSNGKRQTCPERYAPRGASHDEISCL
jgi:hypothetical protein